MEFSENVDLFNKPIIREKTYLISNHKIFQKYSSKFYQKYSFELLKTLCEKSYFENKAKILHKSIYFLLKFLYKSRNNILISNYDLIILVSFYLGIKIVENQKRIPNLNKLKNIYKERYGQYSNVEIKNAELIFIKLLEYKINFMTSYDFLSYLFKNNKELIDIPKSNLEIIIKEHTQDYCIRCPISIIQDCIIKAENNKLLRCPIVIKRKIVQQPKRLTNNIYFNDLTKNIDESLSTSISSGYYNIGHKNEVKTGYKNYKEIENKYPIRNIINKYNDILFERSYEEYNNDKNNYFTNEKYSNNITINNNIDYEKLCQNFTYNKKNPKNIKYKKFKNKNDKKIAQSSLKFNSDFKKKLFQRNIIPFYKSKLNYTNIENISDNNSHKKLNSIPYFKKQGSKVFFTSNKKKEKGIKDNFINKINKVGDDSRFSLKKKLLFDEMDSFNFQFD